MADQEVADADAAERKRRQERSRLFAPRLRQPTERRDRGTRFAGFIRRRKLLRFDQRQ